MVAKLKLFLKELTEGHHEQTQLKIGILAHLQVPLDGLPASIPNLTVLQPDIVPLPSFWCEFSELNMRL